MERNLSSSLMFNMESYNNILMKYIVHAPRKKIKELNDIVDQKYEQHKRRVFGFIEKDHLEGKISDIKRSELEKAIENSEYGIKIALAYSTIGNLDIFFPPFALISILGRTAYNLTQTITAYVKNDDKKKKVYSLKSNLIAPLPIVGPLAPLISVYENNPKIFNYFIKSLKMNEKKRKR